MSGVIARWGDKMLARNTNTSIDREENAGTVDLFRVVVLYTIHDTHASPIVRLVSANTLLLAIIAVTECFTLFSILQRFLNIVRMQSRWKNIQSRTFYGFYKFISEALLSSVWQIALISALRSVARTILLILWKVYDTSIAPWFSRTCIHFYILRPIVYDLRSAVLIIWVIQRPIFLVTMKCFLRDFVYYCYLIIVLFLFFFFWSSLWYINFVKQPRFLSPGFCQLIYT